jgi:RNA polymerase sigma-70 factor, ECF subfamily
MGAIANGDADAVRPLIERYQRPLFALVRRVLRGATDVEDIVQETWMRVVRSARRYDPEQPFSRWLFAIAWNLVRDRWARAKAGDAAAIDTLTGAFDSTEEQLIATDRARRVRDLVTELPDRLAAPVFLRYFEELSEREVAAHLGIPVGTVKSRLHYALERLKTAWESESEDELSRSNR